MEVKLLHSPRLNSEMPKYTNAAQKVIDQKCKSQGSAVAESHSYDLANQLHIKAEGSKVHYKGYILDRNFIQFNIMTVHH